MEQYQSQDITKLAKALISVQKELQPAIKDSTNPFVKNRYASLNSIMDVCRNPLLNNGIWLCQYPVPIGNDVNTGLYHHKQSANKEEESQHVQVNTPYLLGLMTKLTHAESGQWQSSLTVIPLAKADPQGMGSAITYARRYALSAMLGIVTEEDLDGEMPKNSSKLRQTPNNARGSNLGENKGKATGNIVKQNQSPQNQNYEVENSIDNQNNLYQFPKLNGVLYENIQTQDEHGVVREVITASGNTIPNKEKLMQAGFRWNQGKKVWWKYADAV